MRKSGHREGTFPVGNYPFLSVTHLSETGSLKYTLGELEEFIIETVEHGDRFADKEHFRLFIFLRLQILL